jgi:hypothetical protein
MINQRNVPLTSFFCALWPTDEFNFHIVREEWNQIEYTDVAEGGIPDEPTFSSWGWTQKLGKKKQRVTMSLNLVMDKQKGGQVWTKNLAVLASDAILTLLKEIAYAIYMTGWRNLALENMRATHATLPLLYATETEDFMIFALDPARGFGRIDQISDEINANGVLLPSNTREYLKHASIGVENNTEGSIIAELEGEKKAIPREGPRSLLTTNTGNGRALNYFQLTPFAVNSRLKEREDPSVTRMTLCNAYPCDPNISLDTDVTCEAGCADVLDTILFDQTENSGDMRHISRKELIRSCFMFGEDGGPSQYIKNLETSLRNDKDIPWAFKNARGDINEENLSYGYNNPHNLFIANEPKLEKLKHFREEFFGLTFDPVTGRRRIPKLEGDFTLSAKPNALFERNAKLLVKVYEKKYGMNLESGISLVEEVLDNIRSTPITENYNRAWIDTNLVYLKGNEKDGDKFPTNEFGALRLPEQSIYDISEYTWPPYYDNGPGLYTLAREATRTATQWQAAGEKARQAIRALEPLAKFLMGAIGNSEALTDREVNMDKIQVAVSKLIELIGGRQTKVDVGIPLQTLEPKDAPKETISEFDKLLDNIEKQKLDEVIAALGPVNIVPDRTIQALSSLNAEAYKEVKQLFVNHSRGKDTKEDREQMERLVNLILDYTKYPKVEVSAAVGLVSAIAVSFNKLKNVKEREDLLKEAENMQYLKGLKTRLEKEHKIILSDNVPSFSTTLSERTARPDKSGKSDASLTFKIPTKDNLVKGDRRIMQANYSGGPIKYLRTNMTSSPNLVQYISRTDDLWVIPTQDRSEALLDKEKEVLSILGLYSLGGLMKSFDSPMKSTLDSSSSWSSSSRVSSSSTTSLNNLLNFGAPVPQPSYLKQQPVIKTGTDGLVSIDSVKRRYFGPWRNRWDYSNKISSSAVATIFRVLIQAPNHIDTHLNLADYGCELMNFLIFRPFIEFEAKSVVVMNAGPQTMLQPFSRPNLMVTRDERGEVHVSSEFYTANVVAIPENIRMIYAAMPHRWIGGKNTVTMNDPDQWSMPNPDKPSLIVMPTPWTERNYKSPINMTNAPSAYRPGVDTNIHLRKYSSAKFYMSIFGNRETGTVEALHMTRTNYWKHIHIHHVAHIGPRTFPDRNTKKLIDLPGEGGPGTDLRMNMRGAEKTWAGRAYYFPHVVPNINVRERQM